MTGEILFHAGGVAEQDQAIQQPPEPMETQEQASQTEGAAVQQLKEELEVAHITAHAFEVKVGTPLDSLQCNETCKQGTYHFGTYHML